MKQWIAHRYVATAFSTLKTDKVNIKADKRITRAVNQEGAFRGELINAENIGKTGDELVAMWDIDHPDDPVES